MDETAPTDPRELRAQRIQNCFEWPVVVAALLTIAILVIQESDFGEPWETVATVLNWVTWLTFFAEAAVMLSVVPDRRRWLRHHLTLAAAYAVGGGEQDGVIQQWKASCTSTSGEAMVGEYDPIFALRMRLPRNNEDVSRYDPHHPRSLNPVLAAMPWWSTS